jgi:hypothetical protein
MTERLDVCVDRNQWPRLTPAPKEAMEPGAVLVTGEAGAKSAAHAARASVRRPI